MYCVCTVYIPIGGSSVMMISRSMLAWMKWPSWFLRTVPFIPIKQCSCVGEISEGGEGWER